MLQFLAKSSLSRVDSLNFDTHYKLQRLQVASFDWSFSLLLIFQTNFFLCSMARSALAIVECVFYIVVSVFGVVGHGSSLMILCSNNPRIRLKPDTLDTVTQALLTWVSVVCFQMCAIGMPLRAWNVLIGAAWPFTDSSWIMNMEFFSVSNAISVVWMLSAVLALTRFTATFCAAKHGRWMAKRWLRFILYAVSYIYAMRYKCH